MVQRRKVEAVEKLAERIRASNGSVFVDFLGLTVDEANRLRTACREAGVHYSVVKNRLAKRSFEQVGTPPPPEALMGSTAIAFGSEEPTAPARTLFNFAKSCEHLKIKGGFLGDRWLDVAAVTELATIPPRDVLLARLCGSLTGPLTRLAGVLQDLAGRRLAIVLKAVAEQKSD